MCFNIKRQLTREELKEIEKRKKAKEKQTKEEKKRAKEKEQKKREEKETKSQFREKMKKKEVKEKRKKQDSKMKDSTRKRQKIKRFNYNHGFPISSLYVPQLMVYLKRVVVITDEAALILIRHGESLWNEKNLFTGCVDVPLTKKEVEEAIEASRRIGNIHVDMIYTSALIRAQMTAMLAMAQHRRKKVPIIMHNESEQAKAWSQIYSEETIKQSIPVIAAWQLNERMYGELQDLNKQETTDRFGKEKIEPQLQSGKNVMIAAHGNSLSKANFRSVFYMRQVISLELSTGIPLLYIFKEGKFIRRGSPVAPTETGVYAYYTKGLAQYRQKLDELLH
ncbi:hypothetical protein V6N11_020230 [Hibiscus sabdariffa]|uniref:phosphoglycerate mutase (2,3-diphosphoglycerate-dependent) n=1 Tax=Hibiscus sabdariffa TaxID=183260 RepID=A0ABR2Q7T5_9ROSI